ncbi:MAG: hypothetical protein WAP35_02700, partial [Solirubrobacterales bacterium]
MAAFAGSASASHWFGGGSSTAFDVPTFSVVPSTTQAGAHPNVAITIKPKGPSSDDVKDLILD